MKSKYIIYFIICILIVLFILLFLTIINNKNSKLGNNKSKFIDNILNIESYYAKASITITSNKTTNTYEVIQSYGKKENTYTQEIISPENMKGIVFTFDGKNLTIKNTKLNLNVLYTDYKYIENNELSLISFINDYNRNGHNQYIKDNYLVIEIKIKDNNRYRSIKKLYIDEKTKLPIKMEIKDVSENTLVYILYNEIELNK